MWTYALTKCVFSALEDVAASVAVPADELAGSTVGALTTDEEAGHDCKQRSDRDGSCFGAEEDEQTNDDEEVEHVFSDTVV